MSRKRRVLGSALKAKVALAAVKGDKTTAQLASEYGVHTSQVTAWKNQLNAERERRAQGTRAEGQRRAVELAADADLYAAKQAAEARRVEADAEAYATNVVAEAIAKGGLEAVQYNIALRQVEGISQMAAGQGSQTIVVPADAADAFGKAFQMLKGRTA